MECKMDFLVYDGRTIAKYEAYRISNNNFDVELELYYPFHHQRVYLKNVSFDNIDSAVLDYMNLEYIFNTEDCNKLQVYEIIEYFKSQS